MMQEADTVLCVLGALGIRLQLLPTCDEPSRTNQLD